MSFSASPAFYFVGNPSAANSPTSPDEPYLKTNKNGKCGWLNLKLLVVSVGGGDWRYKCGSMHAMVV